MSSIDIKSAAINIGVKDRQRSGWCNVETGELVTGVKIMPGMHVVDVGCGDGGYVKFCSERGADVTFIDIQESKVHALEERLKNNAKGTFKGIVSECNPIPLENDYADIVISTEVLEHVRDPEAVLREIVRIGKPSATYILTVPDARGEDLVKTVAPPVYFKEPNHIQIFTCDDFEKLVSNCGLDVFAHEYLNSFWSVFFLLKWATCGPNETLTENVHPITILWTQMWQEVLNHPNGDKIRQAMDNALPRCQMIVARRKGANLG
jgi:SAM-dependent methyltransferase